MTRIKARALFCPSHVRLAAMGVLFSACSVYEGGAAGEPGDPNDANARVNAEMRLLPPPDGALEDPEEDPGVEIVAGPDEPTDLFPGTPMIVAFEFSADAGQVVAGGIRFGDSGPLQIVPLPELAGQSSGAVQFQVDVPQSVCDGLSSICHSITCYEFAVTDAGLVSAANINQVALACGNCDEPSCQSLLTSCDDPCAMCTADEICLDGACQPKDATTSCELRVPQCCPGQDDSCTAPDAECFCDAYCVEAGDCCADVCSVCGYC